jgi:hypothetical protein
MRYLCTCIIYIALFEELPSSESAAAPGAILFFVKAKFKE